MIDLDSTPDRYRGTIEVYAEQYLDADDSPVTDVKWRWRCKSRNGQILGHGEGYRRKAGALNAVDAMFGAKLTDEFYDALVPAVVECIDDETDLLAYVVPWRLVIVDRHHDTTTGAVY